MRIIKDIVGTRPEPSADSPYRKVASNLLARIKNLGKGRPPQGQYARGSKS